MPKILVVDDNPMDRRLATTLLQEAQLEVLNCQDGADAMPIVDAQSPDLVLTDLQMPRTDGLQLVQSLRSRHPNIPVILMTAHGSEHTAVRALKAGAASYVPKGDLQTMLVDTVFELLSVSKFDQGKVRVYDWVTSSDTEFVLGPEVNAAYMIIAYVEEWLRKLNLCDESDLVRVGTALHEAITNAIEHGNLELRSELKEEGTNAFREMALLRATQSPYKDRRVFIRIRFTRDEAIFLIRDEGRGFDPSKLPDPTDPVNLERASGRGLLLIRTFMDDVSFNDNGTEIRMVKRVQRN